jgi:hypothetical protein
MGNVKFLLPGYKWSKGKALKGRAQETKEGLVTWHQWLTLVILATRKAEIGRISYLRPV